MLTFGVLSRHIAAYLPGTILPALLSFLFLFVFTRIFDPSQFGQYSLVLSVVGMLTVATAKWLETGINRYLAAAVDNAAASRVAHGAILGFAAVALVIIVSGLVLGSLLHLSPSWAGFLLPATLFWAGLTIYEPLSVVFQAQMRPQPTAPFSWRAPCSGWASGSCSCSWWPAARSTCCGVKRSPCSS